jgi:hypothetical protein
LEPTALACSNDLNSAAKLRFAKDKRVLHSAVQRLNPGVSRPFVLQQGTGQERVNGYQWDHPI